MPGQFINDDVESKVCKNPDAIHVRQRDADPVQRVQRGEQGEADLDCDDY